MLTIIKAMPVSQGCNSCEHFSRELHWCTEVNGLPPQDYRESNDCPHYLDEIPF